MTLVLEMIVREDKLGATSVIRALGLMPKYEAPIGYFKSESWNLRSMENNWATYIKGNVPDILSVGDAAILTGDSIKIAKEGNRMAGVKRMYQDSENTSKTEYING